MNTLIKKLIITVFCGVVVGLVIFGVKNSSNNSIEIACDYPGYNSLEEITNASNLIINGIITSDNGISLIDAGAGEMQYRTYDIKVINCIKGEAIAGDIIPFKILVSADTMDISLEQNNEYICFMETYDTGVPASLINLDQSVIEVNNDDIVVSESDRIIINKHFSNYLISSEFSKRSNKMYNFKDELINGIKNINNSSKM